MRGTPAIGITFGELAALAYFEPSALPPGVPAGLEASARYTADTPIVWVNATHVCTCEVDVTTGRVALLRYIVSEDCGPMINPSVVEGQIAGGSVQGIGGVLFEELAYDEDGNPLATTFMDYLLPTAADIPMIEYGHIETPSGGPGGHKGVGEGGAIGAPPAVVNAVADALAPFGVTVTRLPLTPSRIVALLDAVHQRGDVIVTTTADVSYDPYDIAVNADPYPVFRRLREEAPLYYNDQYDFYAVSRYDDVERGLKDRETYISGRGAILELIKADLEMPPGVIIFEDPPIHTVHRGLLSRVFTPKKMNTLEPQVREFCAASLDPLVGTGRFDFVADLGAQMPIRVIGMLLGIPEQDQDGDPRPRRRVAAHRSGRTDDELPDTILSGEIFGDYIDWRAEHPSDDLMTELLNAEFVDETGTTRRLTREETLTYVTVIAGAGNETTTRLIGWAGKVLADHPDQRRAARRRSVTDPERDRGAAAVRAARAARGPLRRERRGALRPHRSRRQRDAVPRRRGEPRRPALRER